MLGSLLACQPQQRPKAISSPKSFSVLQADIDDVRLRMTKAEVETLKGQPTSKVPVRKSAVETWDYDERGVTVLFEEGKAVQVIGKTLSIGSETLTARLALKDVAVKLGVDESSLPKPISSPNSRRIPLQDGFLTVSQSRGQVLNYGLELNGTTKGP